MMLKIFYVGVVCVFVVSAQAATTSSGISNKTSRFNDVLSEMGASAMDSSDNALAETIRRQRALLDASGDTSGGGTGASGVTTSNACDAGLRKCMAEKCGPDFTKCASDSTTVWGNKMDSCRRGTKCTGHEYTLLAPEILADRNAAIELSYYNSVVNCGNRYNNCVFGVCGKSLEKCLAKSAGDGAIAKCKSIADECREQDSGLAARVMDVFGDLRKVATADAQRDEKRLYELRDLMRAQCNRFGAMFDERTLDCVYTVNFFAGEDGTLMASKKLYAGDTFQCTPNWFGVDITTYIENAQRLTRSQTSASAAAMGAGLGTAAALWTSGAFGRAIDTQNAEKQTKEACENDGGEWVSAGFNQGKKCDMSNAEQNCTNSGGTWDGTGCTRTQDSSTGGGSNPGNQSDINYNIEVAQCNVYTESTTCESGSGGKCFWKGSCVPLKRLGAKGVEPTDEDLEKDTSGRICKQYYVDEWCDEYYKSYNAEKAANKAASKAQRQERRKEVLGKLRNGISGVTTKIGAGVSDVAQKVGKIFKKTEDVSDETAVVVNCGDYSTQLLCESYEGVCWWDGRFCQSVNSSGSTNKGSDTEYMAPNTRDSGYTKRGEGSDNDAIGTNPYKLL